MLLLGSCDGVGALTGDEAVDIANDAIEASGVSGRIDDLERRLAEVEAKAALNETDIKTAFDNASADREVANSNAKLLNRFKDNAMRRLNVIEQRLNI